MPAKRTQHPKHRFNFEPGATSTEHKPPVDAKDGGQLAHRVIADLLDAGIRDPDPRTIAEFAARRLRADLAPVYRQATLARATTAAGVYFYFFVPGPQWTYGGSEVDVGTGHADLVFRHVDGRVRFDETKTGRLVDPVEIADAVEQAARYAVGGRATFGEAFTGIRVLALGAPHNGFRVDHDGHQRPLDEEDEAECRPRRG
jgi:hypothetical protein